MDSPTERMPIACAACAKAKAKCDKKVPCSRCVGKQSVCISRPTRRSTHNLNKRGSLSRAQSDRSLHNGGFHMTQIAQYPSAPSSEQSQNMQNPPTPHHRYSTSDLPHQIPIAPAMFGPPSDLDHQTMFRAGFSQTPPMSVPITPILPQMPSVEHFMPMHGRFDMDNDNRYMQPMMPVQVPFMDFNQGDLAEFIHSPTGVSSRDASDFLMMHNKPVLHIPNHFTHQAPNHIQMMPNGTTSISIMDSPPHILPYHQHVSGMTSPTSMTTGLQESNAVITAQSAWPFFSCSRAGRRDLPPKTAAIYLEGLSHILRRQILWETWTTQVNEKSLDINTERVIISEKLEGWPRERLLAITQGFLQRALDNHRVRQNSDEIPSSPESPHEGFMLPEPEVLQFFLRSYIVRYEPYYSSIPAGKFDPNTLMQSANGKAATLLILLMIAAGASTVPTLQARYIASGFLEACRLALLDTVEREVAQAKEILFLRSGLLMVCLAAWSGDKWHMDMAMGQSGIYLAMLQHAGTLEKPLISELTFQKVQLDPEAAWTDWKEHEGRHRLAHSWIIVDQELSLFSDSIPKLLITDLHVPLPDSDELWHASTAAEWLAVYENSSHNPIYSHPISLLQQFRRFVNGDLAGEQLPPTQLRLLLHPIQAQVCQVRNFIACLPDSGVTSRSISKTAWRASLEGISSLLQQWYAISRQSFSGNKGTCWTTCANLIMYHLIYLNTITSFKDIEALARDEVDLDSVTSTRWSQLKCVDQPEEALSHCGQILRLVQSMPRAVRPPWWSGAIYRVAMIGWAISVARGGLPFSVRNSDGSPDIPFAIDNVTPEDQILQNFINCQQGEPMFTRADGSLVAAHKSRNVVTHCIEILEGDLDMRLSDGVRRKLVAFLATINT